MTTAHSTAFFMGRNAKRKQQRKLWTEPYPENTTFFFVGKQHYSDEWPNTSIMVHNCGIFTVECRERDVAIMGHKFTVHTENQELNGIYGIRIFQPGETGQQGVYCNALPPTRATDLNPYTGFIQGMLSDMTRNGVIPSWDDLVDGAVKKGVMEAPSRS